MSNAITKSVDTLNRWYTKVTQVSQPKPSEDDRLVFDRNGSIRLNYENDQVKKTISQHIERFSKMELKGREA